MHPCKTADRTLNTITCSDKVGPNQVFAQAYLRSLTAGATGQTLMCQKCNKNMKRLKSCEADRCDTRQCLACYSNCTEIGPEACFIECKQTIQEKHDRGEEIITIAMAKMDVSKNDHEQSTNITDEDGKNVPPVGRSPRMIQLTIPRHARTNFNAKDNRLRKNARGELQRALATVVGKKGMAGAPMAIRARTIWVAVKETSAKLWECIRKEKSRYNHGE